MVASLPSVAGEPKRLYFSADVTIDAAGIATVSRVSGAKGPLANALESQLEGRVYFPAREEGRLAESTTTIYATAVLTPVGDDDIAVSIEGVRLWPATPRLHPPHYPAEMARKGLGGVGVVAFSVGADGHPRNPHMLQVSDPRIEEQIMSAVKRWRFTPETIAGRPSSEEVAVPIWFRPEGDVSPPPDFACPPVGARAYADENANGCMDRIEITFTHSL